MKRSTFFWSGLAVLVLGSMIAGTYWWWVRINPCRSDQDHTYSIHFAWEHGVKEVHVVDAWTGKDLYQRDLPASVSRQTVDEITRIVSRTGLPRAEGHANLVMKGCGDPYLLRWSDWEIPDLSALMTAAMSWDLEWLHRIISSGINVNARQIGSDRTAIIWAAVDPRKGALYDRVRETLNRKPDGGTVEYLLSAGADPNAADAQGETALMRADGSTAGQLIAAGAKVSASDKDGLTPLMYASRRGDLAVMSLEVAAHADLNAKAHDGSTSLMYAVQSGSAEAVKLLLKAGADKSAKNAAGQTASALALQQARSDRKFQSIMELLSTN
jgi:Ankyrin repeats (3 copies)